MVCSLEHLLFVDDFVEEGVELLPGETGDTFDDVIFPFDVDIEVDVDGYSLDLEFVEGE